MHFLASAGFLAALLAALPAAAQYDDPGVFISPSSGTYTEPVQAVQVTWTHEVGLLSDTRVVRLNDTVVTGSFSYQPQSGYSEGSGVRAVSTGSVTLAPGANTLSAEICGSGSGCTVETVTLTYTAPPAPVQRAAPVITRSAHHEGFADPVRFGSTLTYTTPAYVSMDQERAVTLFYSSELAHPRPFIQLDVTDHSLQPAERFSVRVLNGGTAYTLTNGQQTAYFSNAGGTTGSTSRIAAQLPGGALGTGAHKLTVEVRGHWSSPVQETLTTDTVRVLVLDRGASPYGAGWGIFGLQRIHVLADGLLVDEGDGSMRFFRTATGSYTTPEGDHTSISRHAGTGFYTRTYPDGGVAVFDAAGLLSYAYTPLGDTTRYTYTQEKLASVTDAAGLAITLGYHNGAHPHYDKLSWIRDPGGRTAYFGYWDGWTNLTALQDVDGGVGLQVTYDGPLHRAQTWSDRGGGQWSAQYDAFGSLAGVTAPQITVQGTQPHSPASGVTSEKVLVLPTAGQASVSSPKPRVVEDSVYASVTDPRGFITRVWVDRYGLPLKVTGPLGHTVSMERDQHGQPRKITEPSGRVTDLNWNPNGTLERTFDESRGMQVDYAYQTLGGGSFLRRTSEGHHDVEYDRGTRGEVLRVRMGTDTVARYTYDARLRVKTATDAGGHTLEYFYDGTQWKNADSIRLVTSAGSQRTAFTYDAYGRTSTVTDPAGRVTTLSLDLLNRLRKQRMPGDSVLYTYNSRGLYSVTDAMGKAYVFNRNLLGWMESEVDPRGRTTSYRFDQAGNVVGQTDRMGRTFSMRYDALGRVDSLAAPDATLRYRYDNPGGYWMYAERVGESSDTLHFDASGQMYNAVSLMGGVRYQVHGTFRADGMRSRVNVQAGPLATPLWRDMFSYGYDDRHRPFLLTDSAGRETRVFYNREGQPDTISYPVGLATVALGYTPRHGLESVFYNSPVLNGAFGSQLTYDILDRLESRNAGGKVAQYGYDALGRLSGREERKYVRVPPPPYCTGASTEPECNDSYEWQTVRTETFAYDTVGNRTGWTYSDSTGASQAFTATLQSNSNRYSLFGTTAQGSWTMVYDSVGNLVRRYRGTQEVRYVWNSLGQLDSVYTSGTGWVKYGYNALGMRVRRTVGSVTTRYLYDGDDLVAEVDAAGNRIRTYAYWPGIDQPHSMRTWEGGAGGAVHYYALDLPSNDVRGLFNGSGAVTHRYQYSPFGEQQAASEGTHNPLRFAARELDAQTGLYYVRARWYDPYLGRFLNEDPIGLAGGINLYAYAANDPVNQSDPSGLRHDGGTYCTGFGYTRSPSQIGSKFWEFEHEGRGWHAHESNGWIELCPNYTGRPYDDGTGPSTRPGRRGDPSTPHAPDDPGLIDQAADLADKAAECAGQVLGIEDLVDVGLVAAGQAIPGSKRFRTPGSSRGTSLASLAANRIFGDRRVSDYAVLRRLRVKSPHHQRRTGYREATCPYRHHADRPIRRQRGPDCRLVFACRGCRPVRNVHDRKLKVA
jgi:RHS repeat-associated protein